MTLPCTPEGAREALIQLGVWSENVQSFTTQRWSDEVLRAVEWYQIMNEKRRERLAKVLRVGKNVPRELEGRIDLSKLPCICIDAAGTSFRDDAIGVRSRASTDRKVLKSSKWEILIHTADISDLYSPAIVNRSEELQRLQQAAAKRGKSRYDLPTGPLHLLPPSLLDTLSLHTVHPDDGENPNGSFNRCVTVWLYIDEATGKLLDAGMERTLISNPIALSFQTATDILDGKTSNQSPGLEKARVILGVVERDVTLWKTFYNQNNGPTTRTREKRLEAREVVDRHIFGPDVSKRGDDGRDGFVRTKGHRVVDMCLELHGYALKGLMHRAGASVPYVAGTKRDGRVASAPLRRYIDGVAQRQALAVLCKFGGDPLSSEECASIGKEATEAVNAISNVRVLKGGSSQPTGSKRRQQQQEAAARALFHDIFHSDTDHGRTFKAVSTGRQSEVVLLGVGAVASCKGIQGTLRPGEELLVTVRHVDLKTGQVKVTLHRDGMAN